jgi:two-component system response regulator HydG
MNQTLSILIVDDHPAMCKTLQDILADEGYRVTTAMSGNAALQVCERQEFDVILMDVRMPDVNGVEVFRRLKNNAVGARVIMMSAYSVEELKKEALKEGAIAFLKKPVEVEFVLKLIQGVEQPPVLIVMDDPQERQHLAAHLIEQRYRVYTVGKPEEALELARQIRFHIILIDTKLYTMSALELYLALKEITPTSVTILFAETDETFLKQAKEAVKHNVYTFLTKPLDLDNLFAILEIIKHQRDSNFLEKPGGSP